ncbi:MAG TPA: diacylglycerol kinase family protein [Verrucomicrobiae bacterium]|nr:diacylglycerol kinase family protein [Verrucomicrobiae bacterium]
MTETLVIVNPVAGGGRAARAEEKISRIFASRGRSFEFIHSRSSEDACRQARQAAKNKVKHVVALGGDGLFHHVVEGLLDSESFAGFFPGGNGNDVAEGLGIPDDPVRAAELFLDAVPRPIDVIRVRFADGHVAHIVGAGGMGLDAEAALQANTRFRKWPGVLRYLAGAFWTFAHERAFDLRAEIDGEPWTGKAILAAIANAPCYGSGIRIAPGAKMNDGRLNAVLVEEVGWLRLLHGLGILLTSGNLKFEEVKRFEARCIRLAADRNVKIHGDGELLGDSPAEFEILPGAIAVKGV